MRRLGDEIATRTQRLWKNRCSACERILRSFEKGPALWPETMALVAPAGAGMLDTMPPEAKPVLKALLVVAHPDDESECAAVIYRITHELGGIVDQVIVTNGEAGGQYAAPAQTYYGLPITKSEEGRKHLCKIRRDELLRASRILGVRRHCFLDQKDTGFTLDIQDGLQAWDLTLIRGRLLKLLRGGDYDLVLTLLPGADLHGHHQAVTLLALEAVAELAQDKRPAVLGVRAENAEPGRFSELAGFPLTRASDARPVWGFDRRAELCDSTRLDYSIIVHWVIAEHKSQGMFQMEYGRKTHEYFWLFEVSGAWGTSRWRRFLEAFGKPAERDPASGTPAALHVPESKYATAGPSHGVL